MNATSKSIRWTERRIRLLIRDGSGLTQLRHLFREGLPKR